MSKYDDDNVGGNANDDGDDDDDDDDNDDNDDGDINDGDDTNDDNDDDDDYGIDPASSGTHEAAGLGRILPTSTNIRLTCSRHHHDTYRVFFLTGTPLKVQSIKKLI